MAGNLIKRLFTVDEANQRLPLVQAIVQDIVDLFKDVQSREDRQAAVRRRRGEASPGRLYSEESEQMEVELQRDKERLNSYVRELLDLGIEFQDPVLGLVDFPSEMDGREVCLCWKLGESEVKFWHERNAGFAGRQALYAESVVGDDLLGEDLQAD